MGATKLWQGPTSYSAEGTYNPTAVATGTASIAYSYVTNFTYTTNFTVTTNFLVTGSVTPTGFTGTYSDDGGSLSGYPVYKNYSGQGYLYLNGFWKITDNNPLHAGITEVEWTNSAGPVGAYLPEVHATGTVTAAYGYVTNFTYTTNFYYTTNTVCPFDDDEEQ